MSRIVIKFNYFVVRFFDPFDMSLMMYSES